ncbi:phage major capsid protein [Streptacidiphilus sp. MAP12-16]|uniref:phage major capsid protein n=1 Tax=Streptacidiphilus sp. MAP12-16 TaxID=3156300 RepID=UPI003510D9E7
MDLSDIKYTPEADISRRREELAAEARQILDRQDGDALDGDSEREFNDIENALDVLRKRADSYARLHAAAARPGCLENGSDSGPGGQRRDDANNASPRDALSRQLDGYVSRNEMPASAAERAAALADSSPIAMRLTAALSDPAYVRAFTKGLSGERGHLLWDGEEAAAYRRAEAVASEMRAMVASTTTSGGFQIPTVIDPTLRLSDAGSISPIRNLAQTRVEIGTEFRPVTSAAVTNAWLAEGGEVDDGSPTLASPSIKGFKASSFVPFSFEYETAAYGGALADLSRLLTDGYDQLTAKAFVNGNGTTQPQGLVTALADTGQEIAPTTPETFAAADVFKMQNALGPRFQPNASWLFQLSTINALMQMETTNGALKFPSLQEDPPTLLRRAVGEASDMDGVSAIVTTATADHYVAMYGDWKAAYTIVDFATQRIELVPHILGANQRPTGERGLLLWARVGAGLVIPGAAVLLDVATTA